jgi:predicted AAA+ superfamily ATPase
MKIRPFWLDEIARLWKQKPIVWLSGVRRVGKTSLCNQISLIWASKPASAAPPS